MGAALSPARPHWMQADGFWQHVLAILEGIVWPAFAVYHGLEAPDA